MPAFLMLGGRMVLGAGGEKKASVPKGESPSRGNAGDLVWEERKKLVVPRKKLDFTRYEAERMVILLKRIKNRNGLIVCLLCFILLLGSFSMQTSAATYMKVHSSISTKYQVKLKWKKKAVSKYVIYRQSINEKTWKFGKFRKIATISGKRTYFIDKTAKKRAYYNYRIKAYKGKKLKYVSNVGEVYNGIAHSSWDEYLLQEGDVSVNAIFLEGAACDGMKPDGFQLYRADEGHDYRLIKTIKGKTHFTYTDQDVVPGGKYKYKFRAYNTIKGKKKYGSYSVVLEKNAVHKIGKYHAEVLPPEKDSDNMTNEIVLKLSPMDVYNGDLLVSCYDGLVLMLGDTSVLDSGEDVEDEDIEAVLSRTYLNSTAYSLNGEDWTTLGTKRTRISGKETIYLKLQKVEYLFDDNEENITETIVSSFKYDPENQKDAILYNYEPRYNTNIPVYMTMNIKTGETTMEFNSEGIH